MPLEVFYSYSHEDEKLRDKLEKQLSLLHRNGLIVSWHDCRIGAGQEWREQIDAHERSAHIILLFISSDFIASDYCYGVEMQIALERLLLLALFFSLKAAATFPSLDKKEIATSYLGFSLDMTFSCRALGPLPIYVHCALSEIIDMLD